jgi:hypothetical protein
MYRNLIGIFVVSFIFLVERFGIEFVEEKTPWQGGDRR